VRLVADAGLGLHGLIWASPLGWVEELQPLTRPQPAALVRWPPSPRCWRATVRLAGTASRGWPGAGPGEPAIAAAAAQRATALAVRLVRPASSLVGGDRHLGPAVRAYRPIGWRHDFRVIGATGVRQARRAGKRRGGRARRVLPHPGGAGRLHGGRTAHRGSLGGVRRTARAPPGPALSRGRWLAGRLLVAIVVLLASGVVAGVCGWAGAASQHAG